MKGRMRRNQGDSGDSEKLSSANSGRQVLRKRYLRILPLIAPIATIVTHNKCSDSPPASLALARFAGPWYSATFTFHPSKRMKHTVGKLAVSESEHLLYIIDVCIILSLNVSRWFTQNRSKRSALGKKWVFALFNFTSSKKIFKKKFRLRLHVGGLFEMLNTNIV